MDNIFISIGTALWLGILTSISPCPLAGNIAAISFIGKRVGSPIKVLLSGLLYVLGRMAAYFILGIFIVMSLLSIPKLSQFLQNQVNIALGPILIIIGLILLNIIKFKLKGFGISDKISKKAESMGIWAAFPLGMLFAISFCPISAALFFGSLIPLAVKSNSGIILPAIYGIGTGLPVIIFAYILSFGTRSLGKAFDKITQFEKWTRRLTGTIFIAVGLYYILAYIFKLNI